MNPIELYITEFPPAVQERLNLVRNAILEFAPQAVESIAYQMPAYKLNGKPLIYFAGFKNHIGLYALPEAHEEFAALLSPYKQGKGSVQFPHNQPFPIAIIKRIIKYRVAELTSKLK